MNWNTIAWSGLGVAATLAAAAQPAQAQTWRSHRDHVIGTSLDMIAVTPRPDVAARAMSAAEAEIARLDVILSSWRADSELAALNASATHTASPDLLAVIAACEQWRERTAGAFCARLGALDGIDRAERSQMAQLVAASDVGLDHDTRTITRPDAVRFAPDGLAKGYVIDRALAAARTAAPELDGLLIDIGGDVRAWGEFGQPEGWRLGVSAAGEQFDNAENATEIHLRDNAIATSGAGARDRIVDGIRVSHLTSPYTGWAISAPNHASVIADHAADADALATALAILPAYEGVRLIDRVPGAAARIVAADGVISTSKRWSDFALPGSECQAPAAPAVGVTPWPDAFAVAARYEVPRIDGAKKPYVMIWISDDQRRLVRTLLISGDKARWRESNYVWFRRFERLNTAGVQAVSRPTRAPGQYDLLWDGRDDQGRAVGQGKYTLNIEAAREHGGHSFQAIDIQLAAAPVSASAPAQAEIGAASVNYGPRK